MRPTLRLSGRRSRSVRIGCWAGVATTIAGAAHDHSKTLSARSSTLDGILRPSAFAVFRLTTSSNLVGCSTGKSPGFAPLKILSTNLHGKRRQEGRDLSGAHLGGVPLAVEEDESPDPVDVGLLGSPTVVPGADGLADPVEKPGRRGAGGLASRTSHGAEVVIP